MTQRNTSPLKIIKSIAAKKRNQRITSFMVKGLEESDKLIYAEREFAMLVVKNNLPFSSLKRI